MSAFSRFGVLTTAITYLLIFAGGLVRVSGAGMGCPDWPKCFGRWFPPTSVDQLPAHVDPVLFNFTLAWIEYVNRLLGMITGLLIAALAVWAIARYSRVRRIVWPAVVAALLVAFQGWQGSQVVASHLEPVVVTVHLILALVIVSLLVWVTLQAWFHDNRETGRQAGYPRATRKLALLLWIVALVQIGLGTQIREALEIVRRQLPLATPADWYAAVGAINHIHLFLGLALAGLTWFVGHRLLTRSREPHILAVQSMVTMMVLVGFQIALGFGFILLGIPAILQLLHQWVAALYIGLILILFVTTGRSRKRRY
jgi:heme a synthase